MYQGNYLGPSTQVGKCIVTYTGDDDQRAEVRVDDVVPMATVVHHAVCLFEVDEVERPHEYGSVTKVKTRCRYFKPDKTGAFVFHSNLDYATADLFEVHWCSVRCMKY